MTEFISPSLDGAELMFKGLMLCDSGILFVIHLEDECDGDSVG
jgi:hypothetical protein